MGAYDKVRCDFPLPHHQDTEFHTKDLIYLVYGHEPGGSFRTYRITSDGGLERRIRQQVWRPDDEAPLGGALERVTVKWEPIPNVHGDLRMYTFEKSPPEGDGRHVEFNVRFTNGRVQDIREIGPADDLDSVSEGDNEARKWRLGQVEADALRSVLGSEPAQPMKLDPQVKRATDFDRVIRAGLSIPEAARQAETDESGIRAMLKARELFGFKFDGAWRIPDFQFFTDRPGLIPGIEQVNRALGTDLHPAEISNWYQLPNCDLEIDDEPVSPVEWLAMGKALEPVVEIAEFLNYPR